MELIKMQEEILCMCYVCNEINTHVYYVLKRETIQCWGFVVHENANCALGKIREPTTAEKLRR
jgi:hypothetical protein